MEKYPRSKSVTYRCPIQLLEQVDEYARNQMLSRSDVINLALQNYLKSQKLLDKMMETNFNAMVQQQLAWTEYQRIGDSDAK